tara:strand:- start:1328 stop:1621 length:294 start_codon:yes stop_codon:yes gene_type:complete
MKITKRQLKRIIKEEHSKLINEMTPADMGIAAAKMDAQRGSLSSVKIKGRSYDQPLWHTLADIINQAMDQTNPSEWHELAADLRGLADDVESSIPEE